MTEITEKNNYPAEHVLPQTEDYKKGIYILPEGQEFLRREYSRIYCYFVYKHTTPDGKIYIGYGKGKPNDRWQSGYNYKNNKDFSAAIHQYGWENIRHEILADHLYLEEAQAMERRLILQEASYDPEIGFNREIPVENPDRNHYAVYQLIFPNGRMYVGRTGRPPKKRWSYGDGYKRMPEMKAAIQEFGWNNIEKIVCMENLSYETACNMEKMLIELNSREDPSRLYNKAEGGSSGSGWKMKEETVEQMKQNARLRGRSEAQKKRDNSIAAQWSKPVRNLSTGEIYPSRTAAAEALGVTKMAVSHAVRNHTKTCGIYLEDIS